MKASAVNENNNIDSNISNIKENKPQESESVPIHPLTGLGNACRFIELHGENIYYEIKFKRFFVWTGKNWTQATNAELLTMAVEVIEHLYDETSIIGACHIKTGTSITRGEILGHCEATSSLGKITAMINLAKSFPEIRVKLSEFDNHPMLLNCNNGIIDLKTGELRDHDKKYMITKCIDVNYNPEAECPRWERFISEIMCNEPDMIDYIHRLLGYAITGDTSEQGVYIFNGNGSNGKSTLIRALTHVMGDYVRHTPASTLLTKQINHIPADVARLAGARIVFAMEVGSQNRMDESLVKQLTGGDVISARKLYENFIEFIPQLKLILASNYLPEVKGMDDGIWRRITPIPFNAKFTGASREGKLIELLKKESEGILAWLVKGSREWATRKLTCPIRVDQALSQYRESMDDLANFVEDRCKIGVGRRIELAELYDAYKIWCLSNSQEPIGKKGFGVMMRQRDYMQVKTGSARYWAGINLNT